MITSLSAYKKMIEASIGANPGQRTQGNDLPSNRDLAGPSAGGSPDAVDLSASHDVFTAVDSFFNQGNSARFEDYNNLSSGDKQQFMKIVSALASSGYMGYEELVVNHKIEHHEILDRVVDQRLQHARVYDESKEKIR